MSDTRNPPAFTKGPWIASNAHSGSTAWRVESDAEGYPNDGWVIADFHGPDAEANARLVAAALELFGATKAARAWLLEDAIENMGPCERAVYERLIARLDVALRKASGEG